MEIGQTIAHYRILSRLGAGGMGVVFEAEDISLGRRVALKFLPADMATDDAALQRFQREARAASALNHPNICTIYAIEEENGLNFIAMELLEGQTLDQLLAEQPLGTPKVVELGIQICDALDAAHARGIVHRDIKPANVFLTVSGQVKVLDFGLAKVGMARHTHATTGSSPHDAVTAITRPGTTMGTVAYMSPEQARGEEMDTRSDIFSFGAVLYQMAGRKIPFDGQTSAVIFSKILEHAPPPVLELNPELPPQLAEIIGKALEKDRELRYQTIGGLRSDLKRLRRDSSSASRRSSSRSASPVAVAADEARRHKPAVAIAGAALLAILVVAGWLHFRKPAASVVPSLAVLPFSNVGDASNEYLSDGLWRDVISRLAKLPAVRVQSAEATAAFRGKEADVKGIGGQLGVHQVVSGTLARSGDGLLLDVEMADAASGQKLWSNHYTAKISELLPLAQQLLSDIAEQTGAKLSWEERKKLSDAGTSDSEAYRLYLEARYALSQHTPEGLQQASTLLTQATARDASFAPASATLQDVQKQLAILYPPAEETPAETSVAQQVKPKAANPAKGATKAAQVAAKPVTVPAPPPPQAPVLPLVTVKSEPAGADILLDGKETGKKTPAAVPTPAGSHVFTLRNAGYLDSTVPVTLKSSGDAATIAEKLKVAGETKDIKAVGGFRKVFGSTSEKMGRVSVKSQPKGATVFVGTQLISKPAPVEFDLNPGNYEIRFELSGYEPARKVIEVEAGKKVQVEEELKKK